MDERQYGYPMKFTIRKILPYLLHKLLTYTISSTGTEIIANKNLFNFQSHVRLRYLIHFWERVLNMFISLNGIHMARLTIGLTGKVLVT